MELRRSRRIKGLAPLTHISDKNTVLDLDHKMDPEVYTDGILRTNYEWAIVVLFAFILPVYYFTAFK